MHVGSVMLIELPAKRGYDFHSALMKHIAERLPRAPALRRILHEAPLDLGHPMWADAPTLDLKKHIRKRRLPGSGGHAKLMSLVGKLHSEQLSRELPMWQFVVIENVEPGIVALYSKVHHALLDGQGWKEVREDVTVKLLAHPDGKGDEQFVLCRSLARAEKEKAMLARQEERLWQKLWQINQRLQRKAAPAEGIERRVGRWLGRYPAADKVFTVEVLLDEQRQACGLSVACVVERKQWVAQAHGAYLLRTNCTEQDPAKVWNWYLQLQQAEAAFRCAKSDLSLRPIFHHKTERVEAHILVCFLSLALWRVLEQWMKGKGLGSCARQLVDEIATIKSLDVILPVRTEEGEYALRLRTVARPERMVSELMQSLGLHLPQQSRIIENAVENVVQKTGV